MDTNHFLQRAGRIAGVGAWHVTLADMSVNWSKKTCEIHEFPEGYKPTIEEAISFYTEDARPIVTEAVESAIADGTPFDLELTIITRLGKRRWVRALGEAEYEDGVAIAIAGAFQDITERKESEDRIAKSVEETKAYYDNAPCGYYSIGPDRTILRANDRLLSWLGSSRDEVIGKRKPTDFMTAESLPAVVTAFKNLTETGEVHGLECELLPVNGVSRHVSISAKANLDEDGNFLHSSSVMYDITDLVNQRKRADQLASDLAAMLDNELVGTIIVNERRIKWANKAIHRMLRYEDGELVGLPTKNGYMDEAAYIRVGEAAYRQLASGGSFTSEVEMKRKDGTGLWAHIYGMKLANKPGDTMWMLADITELKQLSISAQMMAFHDVLTGLPNRRAFASILRSALDSAARDERKAAICYLDLDGFKAANDRFGHEVGDLILKTVSERLQGCIEEGDYLFRLGGDEFALIINNIGEMAEAEATLADILNVLRLPYPVTPSENASITGSIGFSCFPEDGTDNSELLRQADKAMYEAKKRGKNGYIRYRRGI